MVLQLNISFCGFLIFCWLSPIVIKHEKLQNLFRNEVIQTILLAECLRCKFSGCCSNLGKVQVVAKCHIFCLDSRQLLRQKILFSNQAAGALHYGPNYLGFMIVPLAFWSSECASKLVFTLLTFELFKTG